MGLLIVKVVQFIISSVAPAVISSEGSKVFVNLHLFIGYI